MPSPDLDVVTGQVLCEGSSHTLRYDGTLTLVDHDLERDLAFQALRDQPADGCLAVREAWHGVRHGETPFHFLDALLTDRADTRALAVKDLRRLIAAAPVIERAMKDSGQSPVESRTPVGRLSRWQLVLLDLPRPLRLAYCRSLLPELAELDDEELRLRLIGPERMAEVLEFRRKRQ